MLYARSRRIPVTLGLLGAITVLTWTLWSVFSNTREVGLPMILLTVLLMVAAVSATLAGPDDALDRTAALPWARRRALHLLAALAVIVALLLLTLVTGAQFTPFTIVLRDAVGLLGLLALGAATVGAAKSWFLPLVWTMFAAVYPLAGRWGELATWQAQVPDHRPAAILAAVLGLSGLIAYAVAGPPARPATESAS